MVALITTSKILLRFTYKKLVVQQKKKKKLKFKK